IPSRSLFFLITHAPHGDQPPFPTRRSSDLVMDEKGKVHKLSKGGDARFLLSVEAILSVEPDATVQPGDVIARVPMESAKTKDIRSEHTSELQSRENLVCRLLLEKKNKTMTH